MSTTSETTDAGLLDLLRRRGGLGISELVAETAVTANAVRQRLTRLMRQGLVERHSQVAGRGRPAHVYRVTEKAQRRSGSNFADLALVLWNEIRSVEDPEVRRGLLRRLATGLAGLYSGRVSGDFQQRLDAVRNLFDERGVAIEVEHLPQGGGTLRVLDCPYPELADRDRGICAVEKMLFESLVGDCRLAECRLDGHSCCQFQTG